MFPITWRVKDIFLCKSSTQVWSSAAKGVPMLVFSSWSSCGSPIPFNTMRIRTDRAKTCAFAFNPHVILLQLSLTPLPQVSRFDMEKKGAHWLQVSWVLQNMKKRVRNSWADWLHSQHSCLGVFLRASSWWGEQKRSKEKNQADQAVLLIFINHVVNLLHVMKAKHQCC